MTDNKTIRLNVQPDSLQSYFITASPGQGSYRVKREQEKEVIPTNNEGQN